MHVQWSWFVFPLLAVSQSGIGQASRSAISDRASSAAVGATALTLTDTLTSAVMSNGLIEAARERVRAAEASRTTAGAVPNPILTYTVENAAFPGRARPGGLEPERSTYATIPLEFLYQRGPRIRRADQEIAAAQAELKQARWAVALDAARAFGRVATAQAALDGAEELRRGLDELTDYNARRVAEGVVPEGDLIRIRVERDRAAIEESLARAELAAAWTELKVFFPREARLPARVAGEPARFAVAAGAARERIDAARGAHPQIAAARFRVEALRAEESYQGRLGLRQLGVSFGAKDIAGHYSMIAGVSLPVPLFDRNRGERRRAEAERSASERQLEWTERTVNARIDAAEQRSTILQKGLGDIRADLLSRAAEAQRIAIAAYREGAGTLLQVLDATRAITETRATYTRARIAQEESTIELFAAAGLDPADLLPAGGNR